MNDTTLHYVYDPLCGWCYGAAPLLEAAADLGAFPGAREGDYQALIASGGAGARATDGLQLHLRQLLQSMRFLPL